jgi:hypothetical protein
MKYLKIIIMLLVVTLTSCGTESTRPNKECNCGTIANDGIDGNCYWLEIRNSCSGNKKKFCFDQDVWTNAYVGSEFCVTNEKNW